LIAFQLGLLEVFITEMVKQIVVSVLLLLGQAERLGNQSRRQKTIDETPFPLDSGEMPWRLLAKTVTAGE